MAAGSASASRLSRRCQRNTGNSSWRLNTIAGQEQDDHDADEDRQVDRGQVLQLDAVLGRQAVAQEAQHEQAADDVGLQHAQREQRPRGAHHPPDESADPPGQCCRGCHQPTVSGGADLAETYKILRQVASYWPNVPKDNGIVAIRWPIGICLPVSLLLPVMSGVFTRLVGQEAVVAELLTAARAARGDPAHSDAGNGTMTHAWLITGPPGSGRSVAALCFAAALQCTCRRGAGVRALPGVHDDDGRHPRRRAPGDSRRPVHRRGRDAGHRADRVAPSDHRAPADRRDRRRRPADRRRRERPAEGGRGTAAVDGVPAVRAVGGSRGHRGHAAIPVPARRAGDPADRGDRAGAGRQRRPGRRHGELGGVGQRRSRRAGAPAGHRSRGPAATGAGAGTGARRRDPVAGLRRRRGIGGRGRSRGRGADRGPRRGRDRGAADGARGRRHGQGHRGRHCGVPRARSRTSSDGRSLARRGRRAMPWTGR